MSVMLPTAFAILFALFLSVVAGISLYLLIRPSRYIRLSKNPWMQDTPWMRLQMRGLGLVFSLFVLMVVSGMLGGRTKSGLLEGFHTNILTALWMVFVAFWITGVVSWILWRFMAFRIFIRRRFDSEKLDNPAWERQMTILFCSLLASIVVIAYCLALKGYGG